MPPEILIDRELKVADFYIKANSFNDALDILSCLIDEQKVTDEVWLRKGKCHTTLLTNPDIVNSTFSEQINLGMEAFNKALELAPMAEELWYQKGIFHQKVMSEAHLDTTIFDKHKTLAKTSFEKVLEINPNNQSAINQLSNTEEIIPTLQPIGSFWR